jgi:anti-anti-sigma factor
MAIQSSSSADGKTLTISVAGRFDFSSLQIFRNTYEKADVKPEHYVIDLKEAEYLDSSALGMLLALRDYAGGDDADIKIINASNDIRKILLITKLDELFDVL